MDKELKLVCAEHNIKKLINNIPYLEYDDKEKTLDYNLGCEFEEIGEILLELNNIKNNGSIKGE